METGETGTEILRILVSSPQKTGPDGKSWNHKQSPKEAQKQIKKPVKEQYDLGKLHCVIPNQSTDYAGLTSQAQVPQGNHGPIWLIKTGYAEVSCKGT